MKKNTIIEALTKHMEATGHSLNQMASITGISIATLSNMKNGKWESISTGMWAKLSSFLKIEDWGTYETHNFVNIRNLCEDAQQNARMMGISALPGLGKTKALEFYARNYPNAFYVLGSFLFAGKRQFLQAIQKSLGIEEGGNPQEMLEAIVDFLRTRPEPLLIIDDAGKLNDANLRLIQLIYDMTRPWCGIIIAGTDYLRWNLLRGKARHRMGYGELYRRIEWWLPLAVPTPEEVVVLCAENGVKDKQVQKFIAMHAKHFGTVYNLVQAAKRMVAQNEQVNINTLSKYVEEAA